MAVKLPATYADQITKLKEHGCIIADEVKCTQSLENIGYYRLLGYTLPLKNSQGDFYPDTSFNKIIQLYDFDSNLRSILFSCIEEIEIFLRSHFSYYYSHKYGSLGYQDPANFSQYHDHVTFTSKYTAEINSNRQVLFVQHHIKKYGGSFPLWVLMEIFTFGMLSYFYADLKTQDKKALAHSMYSTSYDKLTSYLRCCTDLRNICSHYGRLYYRIFPASPALNMQNREKCRLWGQINVIKELFPDKEKWNTIILPKIEKIFDLYTNDIDLYHIAFPEDWKNLLRK